MAGESLSDFIRPIEVFGSAARAGGTAVNSAAIDRMAHGRPQEIVFIQSIGAAPTGTTPVLAMKVQDSDDNVTFNDIPGAAFSNSNAAGMKELKVPPAPTTGQSSNLRRYVRVQYTETGTTPSFNFAVIAILGEALDAPI